MGMLLPFKRQRLAKQTSVPDTRPADMQPDGWLTLFGRFIGLFVAAFLADCKDGRRLARKEAVR